MEPNPYSVQSTMPSTTAAMRMPAIQAQTFKPPINQMSLDHIHWLNYFNSQHAQQPPPMQTMQAPVHQPLQLAAVPSPDGHALSPPSSNDSSVGTAGSTGVGTEHAAMLEQQWGQYALGDMGQFGFGDILPSMQNIFTPTPYTDVSGVPTSSAMTYPPPVVATSQPSFFPQLPQLQLPSSSSPGSFSAMALSGASSSSSICSPPSTNDVKPITARPPPYAKPSTSTRRKTEAKPFECDLCGMQIKHKRNIYRHKRTRHNVAHHSSPHNPTLPMGAMGLPSLLPQQSPLMVAPTSQTTQVVAMRPFNHQTYPSLTPFPTMPKLGAPKLDPESELRQRDVKPWA